MCSLALGDGTLIPVFPRTTNEPVTSTEPLIAWFPTKRFEPVVANEPVNIVVPAFKAKEAVVANELLTALEADPIRLPVIFCVTSREPVTVTGAFIATEDVAEVDMDCEA